MDNRMTQYILKHSKKKEDELRYDFMPPLLEIIERPAHRGSKIIIVGIFTMLIIAVIWASYSKIDVVVSASGSVQPIGDLKVIKSYTAGTITAINVSEGDLVEEGDILIELDTDAIELDEEQLNIRNKVLERQREIYQKINNDEDVSKLNTDQYEEEARNSIQAIITADTSYKNAIQSLEKEKSVAELNKQIAEVQLEEHQVEWSEEQVEGQALLIEQYAINIENADIKINDTVAQYQAQINTKIAEIDQQLQEISANLGKTSIEKEYQQLKAPVKGYINSIEVTTLGETVTSAQTLITIVPEKAPMEMVCYVQNRDIADIREKMDAEIKLDAYPYTTYGTIPSHVEYISPSAFVNEKLGSVYVVKLNIVNRNKNIKIIPGLSGNVELKMKKEVLWITFWSQSKEALVTV